MSLKATKQLSTNRYELEIVIDAETFGEGIRKAYNQQKNKISVPGFRNFLSLYLFFFKI